MCSLMIISRPALTSVSNHRRTTTWADPRIALLLPQSLAAIPAPWEADLDKDDEPYFINHRTQKTCRRPEWLTMQQHQDLNDFYLRLFDARSCSDPALFMPQMDDERLPYHMSEHAQQPLSPLGSPVSLASSSDNACAMQEPCHISTQGTCEQDDESAARPPPSYADHVQRRTRPVSAPPREHEPEHAADRLPEGWRQHVAEDGQSYYTHKATQRTSWLCPAHARAVYGIVIEDLPPLWEVQEDDYGIIYVHPRSKYATRVCPAPLEAAVNIKAPSDSGVSSSEASSLDGSLADAFLPLHHARVRDDDARSSLSLVFDSVIDRVSSWLGLSASSSPLPPAFCDHNVAISLEHPRASLEHPRAGLEHPRASLEHPRAASSEGSEESDDDDVNWV